MGNAPSTSNDCPTIYKEIMTSDPVEGPFPKNEILDKIMKSPLDSQSRSIIAMDICDVICNDDYLSSLDHQKLKTLYEQEFYVSIIYNDNTYYAQTFFPYMGEMMLSILSRGLRIYFFSAGMPVRNENVVPLYLKWVFECYFPEPDRVLQHLFQTGRIKIFSRNSTTSTSTPGYCHLPHEEFGQYKKDLSIFGDPEHSILIDNNRSYVRQLPAIIHDVVSTILRITNILETRYEAESKNIRESSSKILGIVLACLEVMDNDGISIRQALDIIFRIPGDKSWKYEKEYHKKSSYPWLDALDKTSKEEAYMNFNLRGKEEIFNILSHRNTYIIPFEPIRIVGKPGTETIYYNEACPPAPVRTEEEIERSMAEYNIRFALDKFNKIIRDEEEMERSRVQYSIRLALAKFNKIIWDGGYI